MPKQRKQGVTRLSPTEIRRCFEIYAEDRSIEGTARKSGHHHTTIKRLAKTEDWDAKLELIDRRVTAMDIDSVARRRQRHLRITDLAVLKMLADLKGRRKLAFKTVDFNMLARLAELLSGQPDTRVREEHDTLDEIRAFVDGLTNEQRRRIADAEPTESAD